MSQTGGSDTSGRETTGNGGTLRVAVVHDWLYTIGGAERVLKQILLCYPQADVYCLFDALTDAERRELGIGTTRTSFLARMPKVNTRHRLYLPLMPLAIEQLDMSSYDLVISSSYAVAKGVITGPDQVHVSYVHSPMRYAWDLQHQYLAESNLTRGIKGALARYLLHRMRIWDMRTATAVDGYVANSAFVARRIAKLYGRTATVIPPPVAVSTTPPRRVGSTPEVSVPDTSTPDASTTDGAYYLAASRLVPYKNIRAVALAFASLPDRRLVIAGDGPERARIDAVAGANVTLVGRVDDARMRSLMAGASAFIFAAEEDFGIIPLEAQASGTPVIALGKGGALETVIGAGPSRTGTFFADPSPETIADAVRRFEGETPPSPETCHANALRFSEARFRERFTEFVEQTIRRVRVSPSEDVRSLQEPGNVEIGWARAG